MTATVVTMAWRQRASYQPSPISARTALLSSVQRTASVIVALHQAESGAGQLVPAMMPAQSVSAPVVDDGDDADDV